MHLPCYPGVRREDRRRAREIVFFFSEMIEPLNAQQRETGRVRFAFLSSLISLLFPHRLVLDSSNHAPFCLLFLVLIELGETKERERETLG